MTNHLWQTVPGFSFPCAYDDGRPCTVEQANHPQVLLDATHAVMSAETLKALDEYSTTLPSGTFLDKVWKRDQTAAAWYAHTLNGGRTPQPATRMPKWFLGHYSRVEGPRMRITWREILVVD